MKKTSMPNPVKSLRYIKRYDLSILRPVKSLSNSMRYSCQIICRWSRRPTIMFIIFWDLVMVEQIFLPSQVKWTMIISNKLVYTSWYIRLRILGNKEISVKSRNFINYSLVSSLPWRMKILSILTQKSWKTEIELFP